MPEEQGGNPRHARPPGPVHTGKLDLEVCARKHGLCDLHRRRIYIETKANSRHFCLGGKIECRTENCWSECAVMCA